MSRIQFPDVGFPDDMPARLKAGLERWEQTSVLLAKQGWSMPMYLSPAEVYDFLDDCTTPEDVDAAYVRLYEADDRSEFESTASRLLEHDCVERWRPLLQQVFSAYRRDEFMLTIPALLVVCEGVLAAGAGNRTKVTRIVAERVSAEQDRWPDSVTALSWRATQVFVEELYAHSDFDGTPPETLNRHWVLHGRDAAEWTQADCLRLVQALDTFCSLVKDEPV